MARAAHRFGNSAGLAPAEGSAYHLRPAILAFMWLERLRHRPWPNWMTPRFRPCYGRGWLATETLTDSFLTSIIHGGQRHGLGPGRRRAGGGAGGHDPGNPHHGPRQASTWDVKRPVLPWLYALIRHKTIDLLRQMRRRTAPWWRSISRFWRRPCRRASTIPTGFGPAYRPRPFGTALAAVVVAASVEGRDAAEIGIKLGVSANAVRITAPRFGKMRTFEADVQGKDEQ